MVLGLLEFLHPGSVMGRAALIVSQLPLGSSFHCPGQQLSSSVR